MSEQNDNDKIVFVNLLMEERPINEKSEIEKSLRAIERWVSGSTGYDFLNSTVSKLTDLPKVPLGNAALHDQVDAFKNALKPGECGVFAHGTSYYIVDHRMSANQEQNKLSAIGIENILKNAGCTEKMPVILYSCNTGTASLAAELSHYHPTVVAPDGLIVEFFAGTKAGIFKGDENTGEFDKNAPKNWKVFSDGREIAQYVWGSEKIHTPPQPQLPEASHER